MQTQPSYSPMEKAVKLLASPDLGAWMQQEQVSFAFTTYQTNRLFCIGSYPNGQIIAHERLVDKPMGLYVDHECLYMSSRYQIWQFRNLLKLNERHKGCDRLYVPHTAHTTGDLNVHDVVLDRSQRLVFVNTDFSCLATLSPDYSFIPLWQPPFISKLAAEDRCHLNGLALVDGEPAYVTACSATDTAAGWRDHRVGGGIVLDVRSNQTITTGLSMPHSPRWYQGKLWLLNSGAGEFGWVDVDRGNQFTPLMFCPGFVRGLAFWQHYGIVGLSKLRSRSFTGLLLEERLVAQGKTAQCGLLVIDLNSGAIVHWLHIDGVVEELFDVVVLPGVLHPNALGFQSEDIERLVTFPGSNGIVTTKPTVKRPGQGSSPPIAGLPRQSSFADAAGANDTATASAAIKFQHVYHLNAENLAPYDAFTYPRLQKRWQTQPQRGELMGISASAAGEIVGLAIAELLPDRNAELLSLFVQPAYRQQGIGTRLVYELQRSLVKSSAVQLQVHYQSTPVTQTALEPMLQKLGWLPPEPTFLLAKTTTAAIAQAPWLLQHLLPAEFTIFPWMELTNADRLHLEQLDFPTALSPLSDLDRLEPLNSLGLRHRDRLIGWMVTHRVDPDTIRYSTLFVTPPFRFKGRGISLLAAAIERQIASSINGITFAIAPENAAMLRFARRHLQPYLTVISESRQSIWLLAHKHDAKGRGVQTR